LHLSAELAAISAVATIEGLIAARFSQAMIPDQGEVTTLTTVLRELSRQVQVSELRTRHHQEPRSARVQTVNDAWTLREPQGGERAMLIEQAVYQGSIWMPCAGVYDDPSGLLHYQKIFIEIEAAKRDRLGLKALLYRGRLIQLHLLSRLKAQRGAGLAPIDLHSPATDPDRKATPAVL